MSKIRPIIKKTVADVEKQRDFERSIEVNYMIYLMRKYEEKAKHFARKLNLIDNKLK